MNPADAAAAVAELAAALPGGVVTDPDIRAGYGTDHTGRWTGLPLAVLRPHDADAVATALRICHDRGLPVTVRGGNTGLVGAAVAMDGGVLLSTERLTAIGTVAADGTIDVGAGVTLADLERALAAAGREPGLTLASRDTATIGGIVSTDAGGAQVGRHGTARARVAGLRWVTPTGRVVDRRGHPVKDVTGYALAEVLVGAEGTLGVVTDITWRSVPMARSRLSVALGCVDAAAAEALREDLSALPELEAIEWLDGRDGALVADFLDVPVPLAAEGLWLFVELADRGQDDRSGERSEDLMDRASGVLEELDVEMIVAEDAASRAHLWAFRESLTAAVNAGTVPVKLDVGLPPECFVRFHDEVAARVDAAVAGVGALGPGDVGGADGAAPTARTVLFGHFVESGFHVNVVPVGGREFRGEVVAAIEDAVLGFVLELGGTVSAEHGVGRHKGTWARRARGEAEWELMRSLRAAWDPVGILGRGILEAPDPG